MLQQLCSTRRVVVTPQSLRLHVPDIIEEWTASYDSANQQAAGVLTMKPHLGRNLGSNMNDINNNRPMSSAATNLSSYQDHVKNNRSRLNTSTNL